MGTLLQVARQYRPKLELGPKAELDELADWMASRPRPPQDQAPGRSRWQMENYLL